MAKDAEYYRKYRATKNATATELVAEVQPESEMQPGCATEVQPVATFNWVTNVPESLFDGYGRGVVVNGFVMVKRRIERDEDGFSNVVHGILPEGEWRSQLEKDCPHGLSGFSHNCF